MRHYLNAIGYGWDYKIPSDVLAGEQGQGAEFRNRIAR